MNEGKLGSRSRRDYFKEREERPRDSKPDEAKGALLLARFSRLTAVRYYGRHLEVALE